MEIIYFMVFISLALSFGFLAAFFWAVENDQFFSVFSSARTVFDEFESENTSDEVNNESE